MNEDRYPILSSLAKCALAVPATSAPAERVFSVAGNIINAKRSTLNPYKLNYLIFIHDNYDFFH